MKLWKRILHFVAASPVILILDMLRLIAIAAHDISEWVLTTLCDEEESIIMGFCRSVKRQWQARDIRRDSGQSD
jgi:hypothetical protein